MATLVAMAIGLLALLGSVSSTCAQAVPAEVQIDQSSGFVRILLHLVEEVESDVNVAGGIVVVSFKRPVDIDLEKLQSALPNIVGAARRDPDGRGFRFSLTHKATVNSMAAGERLYIDLLPETWTGLAPGLPKDVIEELSRRAREAERSLRSQRQLALKSEKKARVRVATQPTFTRYVFELPDVIAVTSDRGADGVTLVFAARVKFDFGEIKASLPATVKAIESFDQNDSVSVRFALNGKADVRMFREDRNYVVDIGASDAKEAVVVPPPPPSRSDDASRLGTDSDPKAGPLAAVEAPQTVPAAPAAQRPAPAKQAASLLPQAPADTAQRPSQQRPAAAASPAAPGTDPARASEPRTASRETAVQAGQTPAPAMSAPQHATQRAEQGSVAVGARRQGESLQVTFPFSAPTSAAIFRRAGTLWLVFDTRNPIDVSVLAGDASSIVRYAQGTALPDGYIVRMMLDRPRLVSATADGNSWTVTIGDNIAEPTIPLAVSRSMSDSARPTIVVPLENARELHRIADPDTGDSLLVVTALAPARGFIKPQDFVEFRALASTHGVALQPLADDVQVEVSSNNIVIGRPNGLTLSGGGASARGTAAYRPMIFDSQLWGFDRQANLTERQYSLIAAAADASEAKRTASRFDLARFYLSRDMFAEAKGVLDVALADDRPTSEDPSGLVLRAVALLMINRPEEALKELTNPKLGDLHDAPLWRALAKARLGRWEEAHKEFRNIEAAIAVLPVELQRIALMESMRASIETRDFASAQTTLSEFDTLGTPPELEPAIAVLQGRLAQGLGKNSDALRNYRAAADSSDRKSAAQGQLRNLALRYETGDLQRPEMISELETLTTLWRGDETEIEALYKLAHLYTEEQRFRDTFYVMRSALKAHPNAEMTRRIQDEAVVTFDSLFLAGKADTLPAVEALSLFYDFRELTPIGRRGDEMIRRLADRLVSVDLLPQAAELLQHQIDNRLQGAARAQVATRLAVVYLMDRKPDRAQAVLRATRTAELPTELRHLRLLLEARAISDIGRHDLALEVIGNIDNREAIHLRADILWAAKRFGDAAEQIELMHGERWRDFKPLSDSERADILRAAIGYALGGDTIGSRRLREKYEAKMTESPDKRAFEVSTAPYEANGTEFRALSKTVTAFDSLDAFLREMRGRYPEIGTLLPVETEPQAQKQSSRADADQTPTASISKRVVR
ncbi:tetratricopeptide repeat protein [Pseudorhodoplanes sinuspersici]|uniref:Uncharacterized protein n=1 Tax=Pseudorhodoplanes sinuspersici TaxID=1235591 RepID=A0A1W6ZU35_9HYPH|nr:hypothetical protein [Pseudorhodoplanes sinuspersici]ARQ00808.1 hypothetical protein CAK95_18220 [Pseudorhodoplanes sinuspersici]